MKATGIVRRVDDLGKIIIPKGIPRYGKSKLVQAHIDYLSKNFENINIIFIDFYELVLLRDQSAPLPCIFVWKPII